LQNEPARTIVARDPAKIQISEEHSSAICAEIGDRLRIALNRLAPVSSDLARLITRLGELDEHHSPSIVPSIDEISSEGAPLNEITHV
jgi:hypothetical protein